MHQLPIYMYTLKYWELYSHKIHFWQRIHIFSICDASHKWSWSTHTPELVQTVFLKHVPAFLLSTSYKAWQSDRWPVLPGKSRDRAKSHPGARSIAGSSGTRDDSTGSSSPAHPGCCPAPTQFLSANTASQQGQSTGQTIAAISPRGSWLMGWF